MGFETFSSLRPFVAWNSEAPSLMASSFLLSVPLKTTTSHPILAANWMARWPSPPIPITPIRSVGRVPYYDHFQVSVASDTERNDEAGEDVPFPGR